MSIRKRLLPAAAVIAASLALPAVGHAAAPGAVCAERGKIVSQLRKRHGEFRQSIGLQRDSTVIETYANPETGSWTIIVTLPNGMSCLMAAGEAFQVEARQAALNDRGA